MKVHTNKARLDIWILFPPTVPDDRTFPEKFLLFLVETMIVTMPAM